jgi:hypothetical protein
MANLLPKLSIVEQSESKLILKHKHGILINFFLIVWVLGFGGIPLGMIILISSEFGVTMLSCKRIEPKLVDCVWSKSQYLGFVPKVRNQLIEQVSDAKLESAEWSNGKGGGTAKVWVSLITKSSKTRLFEEQYAIESGFKPTFQPEAAQKIKTFINSQDPSFKIEEDTRLSQSFWGGLILFLPFPSIAALILYISVRSQTLILDKISNVYIRKIHTVLGTRTKTYTLDEIKSVAVTEYLDTDRWRWYQLTIVLHSGKKYKFPGMRNHNRVQEVANQLQKFLGLLY